MTAPSHVILGLAACVLAGRVVGVTPTALELLALIVGTLAPDIDGTGAITRPGTILRGLFGRTFARLLDVVFEFITATVQLFFEHRGFLHSPLLAGVLLLAGHLVGQEWFMWFAGGYAVHLLGDAMTAGGIPIWSPFSDRRLSLSSMRTGSGIEFVLSALMLMLTCLCGWTLLPEGVKNTHRYLYNSVLEAAQSSSPDEAAALSPTSTGARKHAGIVDAQSIIGHASDRYIWRYVTPSGSHMDEAAETLCD